MAALLSLDEVAYADRLRAFRAVGLAGVGLAVGGAFLHNYTLGIAAVVGAGPTSTPSIKWSWDYELTPGEAAAIVLGLATFVATLGVALVAASWRPLGNDPWLEWLVDGWSATVRRTMRFACVVSIATALLIDHNRPTFVLLLLLTSFMMLMVALNVAERRSSLSVEAERRQLEMNKDKIQRTLRFYSRWYPEICRYQPSVGRVGRDYASLAVLPLAVYVLAVTLNFFAYAVLSLNVRPHNVTLDILSALGAAIFSGLISGLSLVLLGLIFSALVTLIVATTLPVVPYHSRGFFERLGGKAVVTLFVANFAIAVWAVVLSSRVASGLSTATTAAAARVVPAVTVVLFWLGRRGRGPGVAAWSSRYRSVLAEAARLDGQLKDMKVRERMLGSLKERSLDHNELLGAEMARSSETDVVRPKDRSALRFREKVTTCLTRSKR